MGVFKELSRHSLIQPLDEQLAQPVHAVPSGHLAGHDVQHIAQHATMHVPGTALAACPPRGQDVPQTEGRGAAVAAAAGRVLEVDGQDGAEGPCPGDGVCLAREMFYKGARPCGPHLDCFFILRLRLPLLVAVPLAVQPVLSPCPALCFGPVPGPVPFHALHLVEGFQRDLTPNRVGGVAVPMEQRIRLVRAEEGLEDALRGKCCAEREQTPREELGVDGNVGVDAEEGGGGGASEAVEPREDFVEYDGEAGPVGAVVRGGCGAGGCAEETGGLADGVDEGALEERIAVLMMK